MATLWRAVDPRSKVSARQGRTQLEGYLGRSLTGDDVSRINTRFGRQVSDNDIYSGSDWNQLLKWGAGEAGGTYEDWRDPDPIDPGGTGRPIPPPSGPTGPTGNGPAGSAYDWYDIPDAPTPKGPGKFSYADFEVPGAEGMYADPGYQWRLKEGLKAVEQSKASKGLFKSGEMITALNDYAGGSASQEYGNVFNRAKTTYDTNRGNAADMWDKEYDVAQWMYEPEFATWQAKTGQGMRTDELELDDQWRKYVYEQDSAWREKEAGRDDRWRERDDEFRRETYRNDDAFRRAVHASDDEFRRAVQAESERWKRELLIEERLRFLATQGR